jgi:hypothetical protein
MRTFCYFICQGQAKTLAALPVTSAIAENKIIITGAFNNQKTPSKTPHTTE